MALFVMLSSLHQREMLGITARANIIVILGSLYPPPVLSFFHNITMHKQMFEA